LPKVLQIINRLNLGGPAFIVSQLTKKLSPDFECLLIAGQIDENEANTNFITDELDLEVTYIKNMFRALHPVKDYKAYLEIKSIIKNFKPDIVHTHAAKAGALGRLAAANCNVTAIIHTFHGHVFHSYFGNLKTQFYLNTERFLAKKSSKIIAISKLQQDELAHKFKIADESKFVTMPIGFDLKKFSINQLGKRKSFRLKYKIEDSTVAIGIIGRLVPIKNHKLFLDTIAHLKNEGQLNFKAFIIGGGELELELKKYAQELGLKNDHEQQNSTVIFTSWIKKIDEAVAGLDIVALSSLNEGTPVSLIEAQAASKPVVCTNVGGVADVVLNDATGIIVTSKNRLEFANALRLLINNENMRIEFGERGKDFVTQKFSIGTLVENTKQLYKDLLLD